MSFFTNLRAERLIAEVKAAGSADAPDARKSIEKLGRLAEVELREGAVELRPERHARRILRTPHRPPGRDLAESSVEPAALHGAITGLQERGWRIAGSTND